ncbi:TetR/AcrR family transcriptional regulator C-terminal domain-containing protein [Nonomuraea fuscirosea]|jgi:AcrR family transcriptional regulator|uniref:TetR family transcriptional regulator n=1 Tax=Nonomuraea fuscirosea TaxID=1291556 RepID=A0A2T0NBE1_9ACTN|nr:TetR/AcrR family transcriptional regulator C-terminal domain-containing protein [Nonomuraea fuscirosea]PRX70325.1 TetR family transcriptional regulator [Nonomuraea fuscirosea]WSA54672.1 TetR/AcrR family transcriptional regulator C-terminal domain-containing protein [Nonomuraea fuscirosea]
MSIERLSRGRIVAAAIDLIEREGADAVSMRRIAAELGVGVMSLYNHVPNKDALLNGVAEAVLSRIEFTDDPDAHWTDRVRAQARAFRQIAHHHPRSTMLVVSRQLHSAAGLLPVERALATLRGAGFDGADAVRMLRMFIAYIVGSLLREVGVTPAFAPEQTRTITADGVDPALFPEVSSLAELLAECDHEAEFEFGLELLIKAIEAHAGRREGTR